MSGHSVANPGFSLRGISAGSGCELYTVCRPLAQNQIKTSNHWQIYHHDENKMTNRQRHILPVVTTVITLPLVVWDIYLAPARALYDTGAPLWPFQMPTILLALINAPALLLAKPFENLAGAYSPIYHGVIILLATPLVWWWLGDRIDHGALRPPYRFPRVLGSILLLVALSIAIATFRDLLGGVKWWRKWGPASLANSGWTVLRDLPLPIWALAIVVCLTWAGSRLLRAKGLALVPTARRDHLITRTAFAVWILVFAFGPLVEAVRNYNHADMSRGDLDPDSCEMNSQSGCIHGTVVTAEGVPIRGVYVDFVPLTAPANTHPTFKDWTVADRKGRYSFDHLEPGEYIVGIHVHSAPSREQPYPTTFYPGVYEDANAAHLSIEANKRFMLSVMKIPQLALTTFAVEIRWSDGTHPIRSNILVQNTKFSQATIGESAPQIDNGWGSFTLPKNYDYVVHAAVECDGANQIGQRETQYTPLGVTDHAEPDHVVLTLPGAPCKLWAPKDR